MQRYYSIELLRFLCAFAVAIYHWGLSFELMNMESNDTFSFIFKILYDFGDKAVPVFFVISGLVFSNVYLSNSKKETLNNFTIKRVARLYPLHLLTLFLVILIQSFFLKIYGKYELYTFNDFYHFFLNLILLLGWGFEEGRSFNTPVWTVGQEMVIYFIFFSILLLIKKYKIKTVLISYLIFLVIDKIKLADLDLLVNYISFSYFIEFARLFFSGVLIYFIIKKIQYSKLFLFISLLIIIASFIGTFKLHLFCFGIVLLFVNLDQFNLSNQIKKTFNFLGSLTYSIYLLHTLTFLIFLFILKLINKIEWFYFDYTFIFYLVFTFFVSIISFNFFENKFNKLIRNKFIKYE